LIFARAGVYPVENFIAIFTPEPFLPVLETPLDSLVAAAIYTMFFLIY
jgi:hypothetical protein